MSVQRRRASWLIAAVVLCSAAISMPAQQMVTETRDASQPQDEEFARLVAQWTTEPYYLSPLVDHLPKVPFQQMNEVPAITFSSQAVPLP